MTVNVTGHGYYSLAREQGEKTGSDGSVFSGTFYTLTRTPRVLSHLADSNFKVKIKFSWLYQELIDGVWVVVKQGSTEEESTNTFDDNPFSFNPNGYYDGSYEFCDATQTLDIETSTWKKHQEWVITLQEINIIFDDIESDWIAYKAGTGELTYASGGIVYRSYPPQVASN